MTPFAVTILFSLALIIFAMLVMWGLSLRLRDASIADPFWGTGFVLVSWFAVVWNSPVHWRATLLATLVTIWGVRLSLFLLWRSRGHGEDSRYASMRSHHGERFWWVSLITVFLLQGGLLWFIAFPIQALAASDRATSLGLLDFLGILMWATGMFFEAVGDWQLARFKSNPANSGKVLDKGLWRYTRHPNYFGDFCIWWGLYLIAAAGGAWWTVASPILMSVLLMKVSGVTLLEKSIVARRPTYEDYIRRTNAFFPWFPRQRAGH